MLDYHGNCVGLNDFVATLTAASFADPALAGHQQELLAAVSADDGPALIGAFVRHLVAHSCSDGWELDLLHRAETAWAEGRALCDELGAVRAALEDALEHPGDPGAAAKFNAAAVSAQHIANRVATMVSQVDGLRGDVLTFAHLPAHPRQADLPSERWDWANLLAGRRTEALVRTALGRASSPAALSFAAGVAAAYGADLVGAAYLSHTVGGPRRSHRYRHRLARNSMGRWLEQHDPAASSTAAMAERVRLGQAGSPVLPADLEALLTDAVAGTFDTSRTVPLPDFQLGYRRLVDHLELLGRFDLPAAPDPPGTFWLAALHRDPSAPPPSLRPQNVDATGQDGGGVAVTMGPPEPGQPAPGDTDSTKVSKGCGIVLLAIILIDLLQAFVQCVVQWANGDTCTFWQNMLLSKLWEQDPPDPRDPANPGLSSQQLSTASGAPQAIELVGLLFEAHNHAWEVMSKAREFLSITGLLYPLNTDGLPVYSQFTALPAVELWPVREQPDPQDTFHLYPAAPVENPVAHPSPFSSGATPSAFTDPAGPEHAGNVTLNLWAQAVLGAPGAENIDLDNDRGFPHPCWATAGSVHDDPVPVVVLGYDEQ